MNWTVWFKHIFSWEQSLEEISITSEILGHRTTLTACSAILIRIGNDPMLSAQIDSFNWRLGKIVPIAVVIARRRKWVWKASKDEIYDMRIAINQLLLECQKREKLMKRIWAQKTRSLIQEIVMDIPPVTRSVNRATQLEQQIGQLETRIGNIEKKWVINNPGQILALNLELMDILEILESYQEVDVSWLLDRIDALLERLGQTNERGILEDEQIAEDDGWWKIWATKDSGFHTLDPLKLLAIQTIGRFRRHIWNPSSTNITNKWSVWDGSIWYRAINPLLSYLSSQIEKWNLNPKEFSWSEVADMHMREVVYLNFIDDFPVLRSKLQDYREEHTLDENLRILGSVLKGLRWSWRFRKSNNFLILIALIEAFE